MLRNPILADRHASLAENRVSIYLSGMSKMQLTVPEEFHYGLNFEFLKRSPKELLHHVGEDVVTKLLHVNGEKVLFEIRSGKEKLLVNFLNGNPSKTSRRFVRDYITEWFDLKTDLKPFYTMASEDKLLKNLAEKFHGYRIVGQPDLFESIVWAILGQQINLSFAYTMKRNFVEKFGEQLVWNGKPYFLFPTAELVATLKDEDLLPLQFSRQKSRYSIAVGEAFATGQISKEKLKGLPLQEAKEALMKIKGIGNWTANFALMKTFRYPDAFPLEDVAIHNAIKKLKNMKEKPSLDQVRSVFKKYRGWEAYATLYLWRSL